MVRYCPTLVSCRLPLAKHKPITPKTTIYVFYQFSFVIPTGLYITALPVSLVPSPAFNQV